MKFSPSARTALPTFDFKIVVTGATGWLGQAALEMLVDSYGDDFSRCVYAFASNARTLTLREGMQIACRPLTEVRDLPIGDYLFLHFAFLGKERTVQLSLHDYAARVFEITELMTDAMRRIGNRGIILPSSGAVYRSDHTLDDDLERNPYGVLKLRDEEHFSRMAEERNIPITIARIFNIAGPYINKVGSYALSSILLDLLQEIPVRIQATHPVIRSYVHVADVLDLALLCQLERNGGNLTFDTVGDEEIEVGALARLAAGVLNRPDHPILRPPQATTPINRYVGDGTEFRKLISRFERPTTDLPRQIADTAAFLRGTLTPDPGT